MIGPKDHGDSEVRSTYHARIRHARGTHEARTRHAPVVAQQKISKNATEIQPKTGPRHDVFASISPRVVRVRQNIIQYILINYIKFNKGNVAVANIDRLQRVGHVAEEKNT